MARHGHKDDISTKVAIWTGRGWCGTEGAKRLQITRRGKRGGGRGGKAWAQKRYIHESGNLDKEGLGWHRECQEVANLSFFSNFLLSFYILFSFTYKNKK